VTFHGQKGATMNDTKYYNVSFNITDDCLDEEMQQNIDTIMKATGWTKEFVIRSAFQFGCKWFLKDQLNFIVKYHLPDKEIQQ
jgi:hypothetical protein